MWRGIGGLGVLGAGVGNVMGVVGYCVGWCWVDLVMFGDDWLGLIVFMHDNLVREM